MPVTGEEFLVGKVISRTGDDYSEDLETPTWYDLTVSLNRQKIQGSDTIEIIFIGKNIYDTVSSTGIGGIFGVVTRNDISIEPVKFADGDFDVALEQSKNEINTNIYAADLLKNESLLDGHITGIVWRKL